MGRVPTGFRGSQRSFGTRVVGLFRPLNASVIKRIDELSMEYIAGVRMRSVWDVREILLEDKAWVEPTLDNPTAGAYDA